MTHLGGRFALLLLARNALGLEAPLLGLALFAILFQLGFSLRLLLRGTLQEKKTRQREAGGRRQQEHKKKEACMPS